MNLEKMNFNSNFFKTEDNQQIFYSTNFLIDENIPASDVIVFNYGLVCSNHHFQYQIEYFHNQGHKILIHDFRGHYQSTCKDIEDITFENITNDLFQMLKYTNIKSIILIGHSMGVNVSLEFARKFPHLVKKMILISGTVMPVDNIMFDTNAMDHFRPILENLMEKHNFMFNSFWKAAGRNPLLKYVVKTGGFNIEHVSNEFIDVYLNRIGRLSPELFFQLISEMQHHYILAHLHHIKTETLVIGGNLDKVIPNYLQRVLVEQLPNAELYLIHNGSHVPQVDFPDLVNERVLAFIKN